MSLEQRTIERNTFENLDDMDRRMLLELQRDARLRIADLARLVGLSPPAVAERLRRLEETGVVVYRADVNPRALGFTVSAIVRVSPQSNKVQTIPTIAKEIPEITECHRVTGDDCYVMRLHLKSMDDLEQILDKFTPHGRTTTSMVHSSPIPARPLPL